MIDGDRCRTGPPNAAGAWLVAGMIGLGVGLAVFAIWYQRAQTRRCLTFYGSETARRIQESPRVELWRVDHDAVAGWPESSRRLDVSRARGLVHLRRGLVEDANFAWDAPPPAPDSPTFALAFFDVVDDPTPGVLLEVGLDDRHRWLAVAGRPGTVVLGRIAAGLQAWLADVGATPLEPAEAEPGVVAKPAVSP